MGAFGEVSWRLGWHFQPDFENRGMPEAVFLSVTRCQLLSRNSRIEIGLVELQPSFVEV